MQCLRTVAVRVAACSSAGCSHAAKFAPRPALFQRSSALVLSSRTYFTTPRMRDEIEGSSQNQQQETKPYERPPQAPKVMATATGQDMTINCLDCPNTFIFSANEQAYYAEKQFTVPSRCKNCRDAKKQRRQQNFNNGQGGQGERRSFNRRGDNDNYRGNRDRGDREQGGYRRERGESNSEYGV